MFHVISRVTSLILIAGLALVSLSGWLKLANVPSYFALIGALAGAVATILFAVYFCLKIIKTTKWERFRP